MVGFCDLWRAFVEVIGLIPYVLREVREEWDLFKRGNFYSIGKGREDLPNT